MDCTQHALTLYTIQPTRKYRGFYVYNIVPTKPDDRDYRLAVIQRDLDNLQKLVKKQETALQTALVQQQNLHLKESEHLKQIEQITQEKTELQKLMDCISTEKVLLASTLDEKTTECARLLSLLETAEHKKKGWWSRFCGKFKRRSSRAAPTSALPPKYTE